MMQWIYLPVSMPLLAYALSVATWTGIFVYLLLRYKTPAKIALGLTFNIKKILLGGLVSTVGILAMGFALGWLAPNENPLQDFSPGDLKWLGWLSLAIAPVVEETVFRGYLQGTLLSLYPTRSPKLTPFTKGCSLPSGAGEGSSPLPSPAPLGREWLPSILITALVFTALHGIYYTHWIALLYVFGVSILLSLVRNKTQSIWPGILGHFINNLLALLT